MTAKTRCLVCGTKTTGIYSLCQQDRKHVRHGTKRAHKECLTIDSVTDAAGSTWCAWNSRGDVVCGPEDSKVKVLSKLGKGDCDDC